MATNFYPEITSESGARGNMRAIERHLNEDHYVRGFSPGMFVTTEAATQVIPSTTARWSAVSFADAATGRASVSFHKPSEWTTGHLAVKFWYTSETSSVSNFIVNVVVESMRVGERWNGTSSQLLTATLTLPGPSTAPTLISYGPLFTATPFSLDDELFTVRFRRDGADAADNNTSPFLLVYAKVEHVQATR